MFSDWRNDAIFRSSVTIPRAHQGLTFLAEIYIEYAYCKCVNFKIMNMDKRGAPPPETWRCIIFIHGTDKIEGGLMVLFFGLFFPLPPFPLDIFLPTPLQALHFYDTYKLPIANVSNFSLLAVFDS